MRHNVDLRPNETIIEVTKGDLWVGWSFASKQNRGRYTFTDQRVIFTPTQLLAMGSDIEFNYSDVESLEKCSIGPFLPFGVKVITKQGEKYKLSLMKRDKWIKIINDRMS